MHASATVRTLVVRGSGATMHPVLRSDTSFRFGSAAIDCYGYDDIYAGMFAPYGYDALGGDDGRSRIDARLILMLARHGRYLMVTWRSGAIRTVLCPACILASPFMTSMTMRSGATVPGPRSGASKEQVPTWLENAV